MKYTLRPYQEKAIEDTLESFRNHKKSALVVLPTGLGKTVVIAGVTERVVKNGGKVLFLAHRNKLVEQGGDKIISATDIDEDNPNIVYSTIQAISRDETLFSYTRDAFNLIIVDETHHIPSSTYKKVIDYFSPKARLFGVTATPVRGDKTDVTELFDNVSSQYTLPEAIKEGYLSPINIQTCRVPIDISSVEMIGGDYSAGQIGEVLLPYMTAIAGEIKKNVGDRKTIIFTPLVSTAQGLVEILNSLGMSADYVAGERKDSDRILEKYHNGDFQILVNSMMLTEGYDEPGISCVINLRPTKSEALLTQIIGRGTRLCPEEGKKDCLILDFFWKDKKKRKRLTPAAVMAVQDRSISTDDLPGVIDILSDAVYDVPIDIFEAQKGATKNAKAVREASLARALKDAAEKEKLEKKHEEERARAVVRYTEAQQIIMDTGEWNTISSKIERCCVGNTCTVRINDKVLSALNMDIFTDTCAWKSEPPTDNQMRALQRFKVPVDIVYDKAHAGFILTGLFERQKEGLASYGQVKTLLRYKIPNVEKITAKDAKYGIDLLIKNNWRPSNDFFCYLRDSVNEKAENIDIIEIA